MLSYTDPAVKVRHYLFAILSAFSVINVVNVINAVFFAVGNGTSLPSTFVQFGKNLLNLFPNFLRVFQYCIS
jgi:hypothetical protein